jgi:hypothetical protein
MDYIYIFRQLYMPPQFWKYLQTYSKQHITVRYETTINLWFEPAKTRKYNVQDIYPFTFVIKDTYLTLKTKILYMKHPKQCATIWRYGEEYALKKGPINEYKTKFVCI